MTIRMGVYNGRKNVAPKGIEWKTNMLSVTPHGDFSPVNPQFVLSTLYDVNYGWYTFNGKTYYGYVDVSTLTKGGYIYSFTLDPLTTAWNAGCVTGNQFVKYGPKGRSRGSWATHPVLNQYELDSRCLKVTKPEVITADFSGDTQNMWVVLVVSDPSTATYNGTAVNPTVLPAGTAVYVMDPVAFNYFVGQLAAAGTFSAEGQPLQALIPDLSQRLAESILNVYAVPHDDLPGIFEPLPKNDDGVSCIPLRFYEDTVLGIGTTVREYKIAMGSQNCKRVAFNAQKKSYYVDRTISITDNNVTEFTRSSFHGSGKIVVPDCGTLEFTPTTLDFGIFNHGNSSHGISKAGFRTFMDFVGGHKTCYLLINGNLVKDVYFTCSYPCLLPVATFDYNLSNLIPRLTQSATSAMSGSEIPAVQAVTGAFEVAGAVINNTGNYSVTGATGGTTLMTSRQNPYFKYIYNQEWDLNDFHNYMGYPCNSIINLGDSTQYLSGYSYVQTENASLPHKGFPDYVIKGAEDALNNGAYLSDSINN